MMKKVTPVANAGKTPGERLDAVETRANALNDAMIVQGYLQGRLERNLAELTDNVHLLTDFTRTLADNQATLQAALQGLTETVDRFIRSQRGNGHRQ